MAPLWESTPKRIRGDSRNWLQNHIIAWFLAFFLPGGGTVIATLFTSPTIDPKLATLFGSIGGVAGLALLVAGTFAVQSILVLRKQRDEARKLCEPIVELANIKSGDTIQRKNINVSLMFQQQKRNSLTVVTFEHCVLKGPCVITFEGNYELHSCNMAGVESGATLIKREVGMKYSGVGIFVHCKFNFCDFDNISFLLHEQEIKNFQSKVVQLKRI